MRWLIILLPFLIFASCSESVSPNPEPVYSDIVTRPDWPAGAIIGTYQYPGIRVTPGAWIIGDGTGQHQDTLATTILRSGDSVWVQSERDDDLCRYTLRGRISGDIITGHYVYTVRGASSRPIPVIFERVQ